MKLDKLVVVEKLEDVDPHYLLYDYQDNVVKKSRSKGYAEYLIVTPYHEVQVKVITAEWLKSHPFNEWSCGIAWYMVEYWTDDVKIEDVRYSISRTKLPRKSESFWTLNLSSHRNNVFSYDCEGTVHFHGAKLYDSKDLNRDDYFDILKRVIEIVF